MRPNTVVDAVVTGNLGGTAHIPMTIDAMATQHLMTVLTDLYSDRILAFIREYSTNAHDAHKEAGVDRPIEVTLPSSLSPYYRVRDFGFGLNVSDIERIYSKYGASTKRHSDEFNGMLGLGSKSSLTYAAQFSVISVKNGIKYNVSVSRDAQGVGEMEVVDSHPTTDEQGVEIVIPIKKTDIYNVTQRVESFFQWWPEGSVLVNGRAPKRFVGREVSKNLFMVDGLDRDYIVMGNVAYPLPTDKYIWRADGSYYYRKAFSVVYFAEIGEVSFTPNHEMLMTTKATLAVIDRVSKEFAVKFQETLQAEIDALPTFQKALMKAREFKQNYREAKVDEFTYKGKEIPEGKWEAPYKVVTVTPNQSWQNPYEKKAYEHFFQYDARGGSAGYEMEWFNLNDYSHSRPVFVLNAPKGKPSSHIKNKMRKAYEENLIPAPVVILVKDSQAPGDGWCDEIPTIDWSVIRDFRIDNGGSYKDKDKHDVYGKDGVLTNRLVADDEKLVYISPTTLKETNYRRPPSYGKVAKWVASRGYDGLVLLSGNRHKKFQREHPNAISAATFANNLAQTWASFLSPAEKAMLEMRAQDFQILAAIQKAGVDVDDPAVVHLMKQVDDRVYDSLHEKQRADAHMVRWLSDFNTPLKEISPKAVLGDYPLASASHPRHTIHYINTIYKMKKKGN